MKLEKMSPGMLLHAWGRDRTMMRNRTSWPVEVLKVDLVGRRVLASWNYNPPQWWAERHAMRWRKLSFREAAIAKATT